MTSYRRHVGLAKVTYVHNKNIWKIYWMRGNLKWGFNEPKPTVNLLNGLV
jgi:hypothetical protein